MKKRNGFTLVELLVVLLVGGILMAAVYGVINTAQRSSAGTERRVIAQQDARVALELMAMEIRMASLNPTSEADIWVDPDNCNTTSGNQQARGIQKATANSLVIEMDISDPADGEFNDNNEIIRYEYNAANKYITRSTNCGDDVPLLGAENAKRDTKTVLVVNGDDDVKIPLFRYYDGEGEELGEPKDTPLQAVVSDDKLNDIRLIEVTLVVDMQHPDIGTDKRRRVIYSTSVIPRNHFPVPTY